MSSNIQRNLCLCIAVCMIPLFELSEPDCMKPQLLLETSCDDDNVTSLTMYTFTNKSTEIAISDGCAIAFEEPFHLNDTFYIECHTEEIDCFDEEEVTEQTYQLECEEVVPTGIKEAVKHSVNENAIDRRTLDTHNVAMLLGCSVGALGSTVLLAYGAYKLKSVLQSGSYLIPDTPIAPGVP